MDRQATTRLGEYDDLIRIARIIEPSGPSSLDSILRSNLLHRKGNDTVAVSREAICTAANPDPRPQPLASEPPPQIANSL
jgi:hypothetical protein